MRDDKEVIAKNVINKYFILFRVMNMIYDGEVEWSNNFPPNSRRTVSHTSHISTLYNWCSLLLVPVVMMSADSCCPFCQKTVNDGSSSIKIDEKGAKGINSKNKDYGDSLVVVNGDIVHVK